MRFGRYTTIIKNDMGYMGAMDDSGSYWSFPYAASQIRAGKLLQIVSVDRHHMDTSNIILTPDLFWTIQRILLIKRNQSQLFDPLITRDVYHSNSYRAFIIKLK